MTTPLAALALALLQEGAGAPPAPKPQAPPATAAAPARDEASDGGTIRRVRFDGTTRLTDDALRLQVRTKAGAPYSRTIANEDLATLYERFKINGAVHADQLADGTVDVVFHLEQAPSISRVLFRGNDDLDEEKLREALGLSENNAIEGSMVYGPGLQSLVRRLEEKYQEEGHLYVEIQPKIEKQGDENVLAFDILEGPDVSIDDIEFVGLEEFAPRHLKSLMKSGESWLFFKQSYKPKVLQDDVVAIEQFLSDEGWLDARAAVESVTPDVDGDDVDLRIRIDQGRRYTVRTVKFDGNEKFSDDELRALVRLQPGMTYRQTVYRKDRERLLKHYRHLGYARVEIGVRPQESYDLEKAEVDLVYRVREDEPKVVRDVKVIGNANTKDVVVRRELDLYPGDLFDGDEILDAQDRLRASGFFADERGTPLAWVDHEKADDPKGEDVKMTVSDGTAGVFSLFGGVASGQGVFLGTDLTIDNFDVTDMPSSPTTLFEEFLDQKAFHGGGQRLRLRANPGNRYSNYVVGFTEPNLTGPIAHPIALDLNFHLRESLTRFYDKDTTGVGASFGKMISRRQTFSLGMRQDRVDYSNILDRTPPIEDLEAVEGGNSVRALTSEWEYRRLDSLRNPTEGVRADVGAEWLGGPFGAQVDAWKLSGSSELLVPLFENEEEQRHVFSLRGAAAYVDSYGSSDDVPIFERWYAGGPGTFLQMRGFQWEGMGPHDGSFSEGGKAGWVVNSEYVFPLLDIYDAKLRENQPFLRGVLFADQGVLGSDWADMKDGKWRFSVGAGIRLKIPFNLFSAPLELYYGIPLQRTREDERESFQINFSTRF